MRNNKYHPNNYGERIVMLESNQNHIASTLVDLKHEMKSMREEMKLMREEMHHELKSIRKDMHHELTAIREEMHNGFKSINNRLWYLSTLTVGGFFSVLYIIAKAHHWIT